MRLCLRRPPATPASDARQSPASDAHHRHGPARKQWAMPRMGILGPLNTARHGRIYRTAAKHHRPAAAAVRRFGFGGERPLHSALRANRHEAPRVAAPKLRFLHFPFRAANHHPSRGGGARIGTTRSVVDRHPSQGSCLHPSAPEKNGRPSWSARWRVNAHGTSSPGGGLNE